VLDYQRRLVRHQGQGLHYSASPKFTPTHAADFNRLRRASPRKITKSRGESAKFGYRRYDVVGWGRPVRENGWAPDGRWYSNQPELLAAIEGPEAVDMIQRVDRAIARYPFDDYGHYAAWPGPNSNSFTQHVLAAIPELAIALPPTAIGKDYRSDGAFFGATPSGTGMQLSLWGCFAVTLAWVEGIEINLLGLVAGVDLRRPALKLPGWGRIGV